MIDFNSLTLEGTLPIYMQLVEYIKQGMAAGDITEGDEMPSRRMVSALLGINPNTVQKAYALLEQEEIISSRSGAKSYVCAGKQMIENIRRELTEESGRHAVEALKAAGMTKEEAIHMIEEYWDD